MSKPHEWKEAIWRDLVNQVRAGRNLKPEAWPSGGRCAVALSFDCDHETNGLRDGGLSPARLSWGELGSRRGIPRIRAAHNRHGYKASFSTPAVSVLLHPDEQRNLAIAGSPPMPTLRATAPGRPD